MKKLEINNLTVSFRTQDGMVKAVRDVSFSINKGETLAIVGESGSGKSVTSKAIMGILAGNSVVEGGEIIYDGQDLLKISEEQFHKLRGDRIAMIFQDPMSSLNPIMKIGKQLTEAMLLKNSASKKRARQEFNAMLTCVNKYMDIANGDNAGNRQLCNTFDKFCIESTELETKFDNAHNAATELVAEIEDFMVLHARNNSISTTAVIKRLIKHLPNTYHRSVVDPKGQVVELLAELKAIDKDKVKGSRAVEALKSARQLFIDATSGEEPNYFALGYYTMNNSEDDSISTLSASELNSLTERYLEENFLDNFRGLVAEAVETSHKQAIDNSAGLIDSIDSAIEYFRQEGLERKGCRELAAKLAVQATSAIDQLAVTKNSVMYTFHSTLSSSIDTYFRGIANNHVAIAKYSKQCRLYNKLVSRGKTPEWKVVPANVVDIELAQHNIRSVLRSLRSNVLAQLSGGAIDVDKGVSEIIAFLKDKASVAVHTVTPRMAKAKAIRLLEEVGIADAPARYNQYPFEFSGGMRQRIVIAIALAANPDILICDEPTTALDVTIQSQILELINRIKSERQLTVIFITHDLGVVANMADQIAVMYAGKIVEEGTCDEIFYDPRHPYTWALLASMPDLDTKEKLEAIAGTPPNMIYPPVGDAFAARNKYALEIDFLEQPPMFEVTPTHRAATWLLHEDAPRIEPPAIVRDRIARSNALLNSNN